MLPQHVLFLLLLWFLENLMRPNAVPAEFLDAARNLGDFVVAGKDAAQKMGALCDLISSAAMPTMFASGFLVGAAVAVVTALLLWRRK